jgi:hypothetical protein
MRAEAILLALSKKALLSSNWGIFDGINGMDGMRRGRGRFRAEDCRGLKRG